MCFVKNCCIRFDECVGDLTFLSFLAITKFDERKKRTVNKYTLRANHGVPSVIVASRLQIQGVRVWDCGSRSCSAEVARTFWREDMKAGWILLGQTLYTERKISLYG